MTYNNNIRIILSTISTYSVLCRCCGVLLLLLLLTCCYIIIRRIYHIGVHIIINIGRSRTAAAVVSHCSGCALCASPIDPDDLFIIIIIIYLHLYISLVYTCILIYIYTIYVVRIAYVPLYAIVFREFCCERICKVGTCFLHSCLYIRNTKLKMKLNTFVENDFQFCRFVIYYCNTNFGKCS
jgi:hypothetical protein